MRQLLLTLDFPPRRGGVARYLYELANYLGPSMIVVAPPEDNSEYTDVKANFAIKRVHLTSRIIWPKWLPSLLPIIKLARRYDTLFISHVLPLGLVGVFAKKLLRKKLVVIMHGMDFALARRNSWKSWQTKIILRNSDSLIVNSEALAREVRGFIQHKNIIVVYPCISSELINLAKEDSRLVRPPARQLSLLTVARLVPRKGHIHVLDALSILRDRGLLEKIRYTIVGNGQMYNQLYTHAKELQLGGHVAFMRKVDDIDLIRYYRNADLFVMPTDHLGKDIEGFGTVYIEAGAFGIPSIASDLPGVNEAVKHLETGFLVPPSSANAVADAIEILIMDLELRNRLGKNAQKRAWQDFTANVQFTKIRSIL